MTGFEGEIEDLERRLKGLQNVIDEALDVLWAIQLLQKRRNRTRDVVVRLRKTLLAALEMAQDGRS